MLNPAYKIFFGTLDNKIRLMIINVLRNKEKNVSEICKSLKFNQTTVSHNLKKLKHCGFIFSTRKGKYIYYHLNKRTIKPLMNLIDTHMKEYCEKIWYKTHNRR